MRLNQQRNPGITPANDRDPREGQGGEVIDLATRNVLPAVTQRKPRSDGLGLAAGVVLVGALGAITLWSMDSARTMQKQSPKPAEPAVTAPHVPQRAITPTPAPRLSTPPQQAALSMSSQQVAGAVYAVNPNASPTVIFDASALSLPFAVPAPGGAAVPPGDDFATRIGGVGGSAATATAMIDPKTTVTQGTLIPAVLETAIDTDVPGYVRAVVSADVRSFDGSHVLVPRSSRLIGQYKSGLQAGQKRAYVIWTRLIRPDGVSVNIASPATSFSGETGLAGKVDTHFFERFGSAMLLSVIGGLSAIGGNAGVVIASGGQSAAASAVGQTGQIGPTVRVHQGEPIRVFTARDLDFSKVTTQ
jgi:type IV secretion system protein VirB10